MNLRDETRRERSGASIQETKQSALLTDGTQITMFHLYEHHDFMNDFRTKMRTNNEILGMKESAGNLKELHNT